MEGAATEVIGVMDEDSEERFEDPLSALRNTVVEALAELPLQARLNCLFAPLRQDMKALLDAKHQRSVGTPREMISAVLAFCGEAELERLKGMIRIQLSHLKSTESSPLPLVDLLIILLGLRTQSSAALAPIPHEKSGSVPDLRRSALSPIKPRGPYRVGDPGFPPRHVLGRARRLSHG